MQGKKVAGWVCLDDHECPSDQNCGQFILVTAIFMRGQRRLSTGAVE